MMDSFQAFEQDIHDALGQLQDPTFQPSPELCAILGCDPLAGPQVVQSMLLRAIADLQPAGDDPLSTRSRRLYEVLSYRYIQRLTQEDTAERLAISPRHLRREQQLALTALASHLWRQSGRQPPAQAPLPQGDTTGELAPVDSTPPWRSQVRQELAALQRSTPSTVAPVGETIAGVVSLARNLTVKHGVGLQVAPIPDALTAAVHPTSLRQILLGGIVELARRMTRGAIHLSASLEGKRIRIALAGSPITLHEPPRDSLIEELLAMQGGRFQVRAEGETLALILDLPSAGKVTVLVVDDNPDLLHVYRRYTLGTEYQIVSATEGQQARELLRTVEPDIIVLDVMLPDTDGWELLARIHEDPATCHIPVIVCSVIREEELSLALGATLFVPKPVGPAQFIHALSQAAAAAPKPPVSNAGAC